VKFTDNKGNVKEFSVDGVTPEQLAKGEHRSMDCMDCHNRPAHTFAFGPERAVDDSIAGGHLPKTLPFTRREAIAALKDDYQSGDDAQRGIDARLPELDRDFVGHELAFARVIEKRAADLRARVERAKHVTAGAMKEAGNRTERATLSAFAAAGSAEEEVGGVFHRGCSLVYT
jgi:hypothetical protein